MEEKPTIESEGQAPSAEVLAFLNEVPSDHPFWGELIAIVVLELEKKLENSSYCWLRELPVTWGGRSKPDPCEVFNEAYKSIFITGKRTWNPDQFTVSLNEQKHVQWIPRMWSLYWTLVGGSRPLLESIVVNWSTGASNAKHSLDPFTIPSDDEGHTQEPKAAEAEPYRILPKPPPPPYQRVQRADDLQVLKSCISKTNCENETLLAAVVDHIWHWQGTKDNPHWKAEYCADDLGDRFRPLSKDKLKQKIYKLTQRYVPSVVAQYLFIRFVDNLPAHLRSLAQEFWTAPNATLKERTDGFAQKSGLPAVKVGEMVCELERYRDEWPRKQVSNEIQTRFACLFGNSTTEDRQI